ncbi:MAG TPA: D-alanyl-D-alanine carboxypeptidase family protein [Stellaceae bacterium]|nr:D-alanyl-D-alanine carboxypeptidase family protein [Stellaceae bacterium]
MGAGWGPGGLRDARVSVVVAVLALVMVVWPMGSADASRKAHSHGGGRQPLTSIVIDAETGTVVSESNADLQHYPASLTKMMTLYLIFEALDKGRIQLDMRLPVSEHAANQSPTKLGLVAGDSIAVRDVVLGLVTRSANDAAVVAAEWLGGSEEIFAERMTAKAHALGMSRTVFHNASGLPDTDQITTARDLSKLARALYRDFPGMYPFFATREFIFRGQVIANHNHLMDHFDGMDGIKTGYIRTSGFNLAASAVRNGRRLIGVVMGGDSAHSRDLQMAALLNDGFSRTAPDTMETLTASVSAPAAAPTAPAFTGGAGAFESQSFGARAKRVLRHLSPIGTAEASTGKSSRGDVETGRWGIQVGAFAQQGAAEKAAQAALAHLPGAKGHAVSVAKPGEGEKDRFYRARIGGFSEKDAERACQTLHKKHRDCALVAPSALHVAQN